MINKKMVTEYQERYGLSDRQTQSWIAKAENLGVPLKRYFDYRLYCLIEGVYFSDSEESYILNSDKPIGLLEIELELERERKRQEKKRKEIERQIKIDSMRTELLELCKKYGAELLEDEEGDCKIANAIEAPYAEDIHYDFPFAILL